jgi:GAF domain-containing protein/sugar diacid utilization regulator
MRESEIVESAKERSPRRAISNDALRDAAAAFALVASALESASDMDELLHVVARQISELVGVARCTIALRSEDTGLFHGCIGRAGGQSLDSYVKQSLTGPLADEVITELLETQRPVLIHDARSDPRVARSTVRCLNVRSMMAVPLVFQRTVIGVIYLDDVDRPRVFSSSDAEVAAMFGRLAAASVKHAQMRSELRSLVDAAERENRALRRTMAVQERLSDLVVAGGSLQKLVQALAELLVKPCAVHDADNVQLAVASAPGVADGIVPRLLETSVVDAPAVQQALAAGNDSRAFLVGPLPDAGVAWRHLVAPIVVHGQFWGRLVVMEHRTRFTGGDMLTVRRAASLIALQMGTERRAVEDAVTAGASLVAELLGGYSDPEAVQHRADRLGVRLDKPHFVALIHSRHRDESPVSDVRATLAAFRAVAPDASVRAAPLGGGVAALVELPDRPADRLFAERADELLERILEVVRGRRQLVAGISSMKSDPREYSEAYREAQQVVECIRRFGKDSGPAVLSAADLGPGRVFLATCDPDVVRNFADATFAELTQDPSKVDLLATLCSFFENTASIRRCASELGVHENTIRYRLSRIEELTGLPVTHDPDGQLRARLSLLVLRLEDRLPRAVAGGSGSEQVRDLADGELVPAGAT